MATGYRAASIWSRWGVEPKLSAGPSAGYNTRCPPPGVPCAVWPPERAGWKRETAAEKSPMLLGISSSMVSAELWCYRDTRPCVLRCPSAEQKITLILIPARPMATTHGDTQLYALLSDFSRLLLASLQPLCRYVPTHAQCITVAFGRPNQFGCHKTPPNFAPPLPRAPLLHGLSFDMPQAMERSPSSSPPP